MMYARRLFTILALLPCACFALRAHADTTIGSGTFSADDSTFVYNFSPSTSQTYTFATTSFAGGGFIPVLTLFKASGGNPIAFAETDNSDVSLTEALGAGSYVLYLTEDPNVFTSDLATGPLFAGSPTITGDTCGVSGGKFLNVFTAPCTQRTGNYAVTLAISPTATPEPATWLLVLPPLGYLCFSLRRRRIV